MKNINLEQAYQQGIISFEQAVSLYNMGEAVAAPEAPKPAPEAPKPAPEKPKAAPKSAPKRKSAKKSKKAPQPPVKVSETGEAYQMPTNHTLTAHQVKRLDNAVLKLWEAGYEKAEWRIQGKWAWIYLINEEKGVGYSPAFKAAVEKAFKGSKWEYSERRGAVVYKNFLK